MPGRGDAYEKYLETFEHWRQRGWSVSAADWRGQAASGRFGADAVTGHVDDFALWVGDLAALWREWARGRIGFPPVDPPDRVAVRRGPAALDGARRNGAPIERLGKLANSGLPPVVTIW